MSVEHSFAGYNLCKIFWHNRTQHSLLYILMSSKRAILFCSFVLNVVVFILNLPPRHCNLDQIVYSYVGNLYRR